MANKFLNSIGVAHLWAEVKTWASKFENTHTKRTAKSTSAIYKVTLDDYGHVISVTPATSGDIEDLGVKITDTTYNLLPTYNSPNGESAICLTHPDSDEVVAKAYIAGTDGIVVTTNNLSLIEVTHLVESGYKHIPSGGAENQVLSWTEDGTAEWKTAYAVNDADGKSLDRFYESTVPSGTFISQGDNINQTAYCKVGNYCCYGDDKASTLTNCPTSNSFIMRVYNLHSTDYDNESSGGQYRVRMILDSSGNQYVQMCGQLGTGTDWTFPEWKKIATSGDLSRYVTTATANSTYLKITDASNTYATISDMEALEESLSAEVSKAFTYKGSVDSLSKLPTTPEEGDVYNITVDSIYGMAGSNVVWNGSAWDSLGSTFVIEAMTTEEIDAICV